MLMVAAVAVPASAQVKFEASFLFGYTFSEGVSGDAVITPSGTFNSVDVKSGGALGFSVGVVAHNGGEVGFVYSRQMSQLSLSGLNQKDLGDMNIDSYHGYIGYNFMYDTKMNPYIQIGFGATDYGQVNYTNFAGAPGAINGPARFSANIAAGVKFFVNDHFGFRAGAVYTPTYISSTAEGWWCDPYWGCYLVGDNKYSNQFQLQGGFTVRFGGK